MKFNTNMKLPQKSLFGFEILSSLQSSLSCYLLLLLGRILNPLFGLEQLQIISGLLFNIILNLSILILIFNIIQKRKQVQIFYFVLLNSFLFLYLPIAFYLIQKYFKYLVYMIS